MQLAEYSWTEADDGSHRQRIDLKYCHGRRNEEMASVYFEFEGAKRTPDTSIHNAAFLIGAAFAYLRQEPYHQTMPIDTLLARHWDCAVREWRSWPGGKSPTPISVPTVEDAIESERSNAIFFSGGVDSFFSLMMSREDAPVAICIEYANNTCAEKEAAFDKLSSLKKTALEAGFVAVFPVVTNMMVFHPLIIDRWADQLHGAYLASVAHLLSANVKSATISSSFVHGNLKPWGSHPLIDPLMSSRGLQIKHFGNPWSRMEKTKTITTHPIAQQNLSVCEYGRFAKPGTLNCGNCIKCTRTMLAIDALGLDLADWQAFDWSLYDLKKIRKRFIATKGEMRILQQIAELAKHNGRDDIAETLNTAFKRSAPFMFLKDVERALRRRFPILATMRHQLSGFRNSLLRLIGFNY